MIHKPLLHSIPHECILNTAPQEEKNPVSESKEREKKKQMYTAATKKGPKGISLLKVIRLTDVHFCHAMYAKTYTVPIQKAKNKDATPEESPKNHPIPKASFASPSPIPFPLVTSHKKKKERRENNPRKHIRN
jgi:hypothetical protein